MMYFIETKATVFIFYFGHLFFDATAAASEVRGTNTYFFLTDFFIVKNISFYNITVFVNCCIVLYIKYRMYKKYVVV